MLEKQKGTCLVLKPGTIDHSTTFDFQTLNHPIAEMNEPHRDFKEKLKSSVIRSLQRSPKCTAGLRGKLIHLQHPEFFTNDAELLMARPTRAYSELVQTIEYRFNSSRSLVKVVIDEMEKAKTVAVTSGRKPKGTPKLIHIGRVCGAHTDCCGAYEKGQYVGFSMSLREVDRFVSVLHTFDPLGVHISSIGWEKKANCDPQTELQKAIKKLRKRKPGDIKIQLFFVEIFDITFGLIEARKKHVEYVPFGLGFFPPWNGQYDT